MAKKIALITPWPPQASGIADYAYNLAAHMIGPALDVHVITSERSPIALEGVSLHHVDEISTGAVDLAQYDAIVFQMGNHPHFHGFMLDLIPKYKCVVQLHDLLLHHCVMGESGMSDGGRRYFAWIESAYGPAVAERFKASLQSNPDILKCPLVVDYPCSDVVVKEATGVIVHSQFAKKALSRSGKESEIIVVPLCYSESLHKEEVDASSNSSAKPVRIGVFGGIQRNRQVNVILEVLKSIGEDSGDWRLDLVGEVDSDCADLIDFAKSFDHSGKIKFHGRVEIDDLEKCMSQCDIVISLRNPTMGETSGIVVRAMNMGAVSIVSDVGWYSELPDFVLKVDNGNAHEDLKGVLSTLLENSEYRESISRQTLSYASQNLNLRVVADDILHAAFYQFT